MTRNIFLILSLPYVLLQQISSPSAVNSQQLEGNIQASEMDVNNRDGTELSSSGPSEIQGKIKNVSNI